MTNIFEVIVVERGKITQLQRNRGESTQARSLDVCIARAINKRGKNVSLALTTDHGSSAIQLVSLLARAMRASRRIDRSRQSVHPRQGVSRSIARAGVANSRQDNKRWPYGSEKTRTDPKTHLFITYERLMTRATGNPLIGPLLPGVNPADKFPRKRFVARATIVAHYGEFHPC